MNSSDYKTPRLVGEGTVFEKGGAKGLDKAASIQEAFTPHSLGDNEVIAFFEADDYQSNPELVRVIYRQFKGEDGKRAKAKNPSVLCAVLNITNPDKPVMAWQSMSVFTQQAINEDDNTRYYIDEVRKAIAPLADAKERILALAGKAVTRTGTEEVLQPKFANRQLVRDESGDIVYEPQKMSVLAWADIPASLTEPGQ